MMVRQHEQNAEWFWGNLPAGA